MLRAKDKEKFLSAEVKEIDGLSRQQVFELVRRDSLRPDTQYMRAVWTYRRKRAVDGTLLKHKARLCADGRRQVKGIHFDEVFAPVVSWSTVRLILFLSNLLGLATRQIDFVQAFTQADADRDIYMEIPQGWGPDDVAATNRDYVLKLKKNLYGSRNAARNWWLRLRGGLLRRRFIQSEIDPCLFMRDDCLLVCYSDDVCLLGRNQHVLQQVIADLREEFILDDEGEVKDFLGVRVENNREAGTLTLTQQGLIDLILRQVGLDLKTWPLAWP